MKLLFSILLISLCFSSSVLPAIARGGSPNANPTGYGYGTQSGSSRHLFGDKGSQISVDVAQGYMTNSDLEKAIKDFGQRCSNISRVYSIGRSVYGVPLWVIEISDKPGEEEPEPAFKYIGNVHGDEPVGRELLMHLANWICDNYLIDPVATLIVDNVHLHILPSMNPDGFLLRRRGNANNIDLNRDFPDQFFHMNDDVDVLQPETRAIMKWLRKIHFTASASLHGGALVANYPWDGTQDKRRTYFGCPDDKTFRFLASVYSRSHHNMSLSKEFGGGITNGASWYPIYGGMQDWNYIYGGCLELTLEISENKWPTANELLTLWEYNKKSMLNLVASLVQTGVHGRIFSSDGGRPLPGSIAIKGINYTVKARTAFADYHRLLAPGGRYEVTAIVPGYKSKTTVIWLEESGTNVDFILDPEVDRRGTLVRSACKCSWDSMNIIWGTPLEVYLLLIVIAGFLLFLYRRRTFSRLKQRQLAGSKRPVVV
ncbi:carboxypeptidase SOL1 isoform X1 [Rosa rugosa]|uniref:carboxypeptidase SOL1 isoform X1 n=1 Tax=Rosa rugosa TaxID=74645 RepID=UPI002B41383D|nr:carboxypeptidase SOL1 isoform X1 [Rosa rugosa]XP_062019627.1 carboxypeptidase SOL1 isoform X1 [Rosa rugosa]